MHRPDRTLLFRGVRQFEEDELIQDAVLRNLQVLAESSQRISPELKARHQSIDWRGSSGFRNVVVHDYLGINVARVWHIVAADLPALKNQMKLVIVTLNDPGKKRL